jgi:hypothetical protein
LAVPNEKIGVPFSSAAPTSALTDDEKATVLAELRKCEPKISAGNLHVLEFTLEICRRCDLSTPAWVLPHALDAINTLLKLHPRTRNKMIQREIHQLRWATVHHLRHGLKLTWDAAYIEATKELYDTRAQGTEETIRASYKWMTRHPIIKSIRQHGMPGELDEFAREQYGKRQDISERLAGLELRDRVGRRRGK